MTTFRTTFRRTGDTRGALLLVAIAVLAPSLHAAPVAERLTGLNAAGLLFGGSDPIGGAGDWYVSNGVVEAVVDDVGPQADLVPLLAGDTPPIQNFAAATGGMLVDLGLVDRDNDQFSQMFTVAGLSSANRVLYDSVTAGVDGDTATVTATGRVTGFNTGATPVPPESLEIVTAYSATGSDPFLVVTSTVTNHHPTNVAAGLGSLIDPIIWTQRGPLPFSPLPARGFRHGVLDLSNPLVALEQPLYAVAPGNLGPADGVLDPATGAGTGEVAYGLVPVEISVDQDGEGGAAPVVTQVQRMFGVSNNTTTALGTTPATSGLQPGGVLRYVRRLYVGDRNDVANLTDRILPFLAGRFGFATGTISGDVDGTDTAAISATVIATRTGGPSGPFENGTPITQIRTTPDGTFTGVVLPEGTYDVEVRAPERPAVTVSGVAVTAGANTVVAVPRLAGVGTVRLRVVEQRKGRDPAMPARVVVRGLDGTPDPVFNKHFDAALIDPTGLPDTDLHPETFGGGMAQGTTVFVAVEGTAVELAPGKYELIAARGPEYGLQRRRLTVKAGRSQKATFKLRHLVQTPDALAADFHVHSARSFDASAPLRDRVVSYAAEGVDVIVSTDHDMHVDYAPVIAGLNLGNQIASIVGDEVTTAVENPPSFPGSIGHLNGWPVTVDATARRRGAIEDEFVAPNVIFSRLRATGAHVVQFNHPRDVLNGLTSLGFFTNIAFDPDKPLADAPNDVLLDRDVLGPGRTGVMNPDGFRNLDFDTMEIANGLGVPMFLAVRRDWLALLNQTDRQTIPFIAGTGVSDSHRLTLETPGYFRTYVFGVGDAPATLDRALFDDAVRAGAMVGTNGPALQVTVASGATRVGPGAVIASSDGNVSVSITVDAASWIPVEQVRVIANGFVVQTFDRSTSPAVKPAPSNPYSRSTKRVRRFQATLPMTVTQDTYFIVEAGASLDPPSFAPEPAARVVPGLVPIAFSNPVFVDRGGDGIVPPGLPVMATASGLGEALPAFAQVTTPTASRQTARTAGTRIPSGPEQHARMLAARGRATTEYFPVGGFTLPAPERP